MFLGLALRTPGAALYALDLKPHLTEKGRLEKEKAAREKDPEDAQKQKALAAKINAAKIAFSHALIRPSDIDFLVNFMDFFTWRHFKIHFWRWIEIILGFI